ncbi:DUF1993 family protein [Marinobacter sp. JSM 1782161]|uniref:DUF1993 family protein n=1 Tax=Marinobacter sp. JSM 1782161 TaxID=2685906 RepID=UPI0014042154|nr:DUF1993 family protein [Marinobacter sp. JSM 1782161]
MDIDLKQLLRDYLERLDGILERVPEPVFHKRLAEDMFSLGMNARISANFSLRGYCPLVGQAIPDFGSAGESKAEIRKQLHDTLEYLASQPDVTTLDRAIQLTDRAGLEDITLPQPAFIHSYILPNVYFHLSMVYAIARLHGAPLGKGDFDGLHRYPAGFRFVPPSTS